MAQPQEKYISSEDYLAGEEIAEYKSEYYHGEVFAMTGASLHHNVIAGNIFANLHQSLRDSPCFVFSSDMKIRVDEARHYTYPDISIVCGDIEFAAKRNDTLCNPVVIMEVLSKSTMDYDRGSKFTAYRNIPSLKDYILIDQYACHVEHFSKNKSDRWMLEEYRQPDDMLQIPSVNARLALKEIYHRVL